MPIQLNFDEERRYPDDPSEITIPVLLTHGEKSLRIAAKADPGAQVLRETSSRKDGKIRTDRTEERA